MSCASFTIASWKKKKNSKIVRWIIQYNIGSTKKIKYIFFLYAHNANIFYTHTLIFPGLLMKERHIKWKVEKKKKMQLKSKLTSRSCFFNWLISCILEIGSPTKSLNCFSLIGHPSHTNNSSNASPLIYY